VIAAGPAADDPAGTGLHTVPLVAEYDPGGHDEQAELTVTIPNPGELSKRINLVQV